MKFFDFGQEAKGVIAIGQLATGFFAIGQLATGVIAIGQLARGGICIGQGAVGLVAGGMGAVGVFGAGGMIGIGGRGKGIVLPCVPSLGKPRVPPPLTTLQAIGPQTTGWIEVSLVQLEAGLALTQNGQALPVKLDRRVVGPALGIGGDYARGVPVLAHVLRSRDFYVCDKLMVVPERPYKLPGFWGKAAAQFVLLIAIGIGFWPAAGNDLMEHLGNIARWDDGPAKPTTTTPSTKPPKKR